MQKQTSSKATTFSSKKDDSKYKKKTYIEKKFVKPSEEAFESNLKGSTVGLVHLDEFQKIKESVADNADEPKAIVKKPIIPADKKPKKAVVKKSKLSFAEEIEDGDDIPPETSNKKQKVSPSADQE